MLFGCILEKPAVGVLLSSRSLNHASITQADAVNHCSSHNNDCNSSETECNVCHSAHCFYVPSPLLLVSFVKADQAISLKEPKSYQFSYSTVLLRPPIS